MWPSHALKRASWCSQSSTIRYKQGTSSKVIHVANRTPHANETAIGMKGAVAGVEVDMSGTRPTKVVTEVNMMGRNAGENDEMPGKMTTIPIMNSNTNDY